MIKKLFFLIVWMLGLLLLAAGCWILGIYLGWPLWRSALMFAGVLLAGVSLWWLRRQWLAWRLRRRLARPVGTTAISTARLDADWRAGVATLKRSRLSRFGSPLYVLPWYMILGPHNAGRGELLRRVAGAAPVTGRSDDPAMLQWWLLPNGVILDPTEAMGDQTQAADAANWRRLLHWLMHTRRREPLNGLILSFDAAWLADSADVDLAETGQVLRKRLDELTRIYDARVPVYIVLTGCEAVHGFGSWAQALGTGANHHAMGYLNPAPNASVGQFVSDAFNSIVHRMFDLRVLQGARGQPAPEAFALPERMAPLARQLVKVLRPAFQATPYAETPLMRGLFLTAQQAGGDRSQPAWFSPGLFNQVLPAQRHAWQPVERWRHWRRLLRHAAVVGWLGACVGAGALLLHTSKIAREQLQAAALATYGEQDFSGSMSSDLHALQGERSAIHGLLARPDWQKRWMPFQHQVNRVQATLMRRYVSHFHREIIAADLDPLLISSLPQLSQGENNTLVAAWAQTLVRRINLLDAVLSGGDVYRLPAPGTELALLLSSAHQSLRDPMDALLLGSMYRDYLAWQTNHGLLHDELLGLRQVLANLNLTERPINWIFAWVHMQGNLNPVRMTDFWNIPARPDLPYVPAAVTPEGVRAANGFLNEAGKASGNSEEWGQRRKEFEDHYQSAGVEAWYEFTDAFADMPALLADGTARRAVMTSLLGVNDPYRRLMQMLTAVGTVLPADARPEWIIEATRLHLLNELAAGGPHSGTGDALSKLSVLHQVSGQMIRNLPHAASLDQGLARLGEDNAALNLLQTYQQGVRATITPLQQGEGTAMKAAIDIWSYGHDPNVKDVPLVNARSAIDTLRAQQGTPGSRTQIVWDLATGPLDFVLDYAARSAGCRLQQSWENTVLSAVQGVTDAELADQLLYGDRGQIKAFLDGDIKAFVDRDSVRYDARPAMGKKVPLNGQFYAFASMTQLRQVSLAASQMQAKRDADEAHALTQQQAELDKQIAKLQATTATVTLSTVPPQTNADALALPESVTLTLQCASGAITLENLNFPNSAVFPWSMATCGDTTLRVRYANFDLTRHYGGALGFVDFLRDYASGSRRYTPADFPDQQSSMTQANIKSLVITYRQQGQAPLQSAFTEASRLQAQAEEIRHRLAALQPGTAPGTAMPAPAPAPTLPQRIVSYCMGPANELPPIPVPVAPPAQPEKAASAPAPHRAAGSPARGHVRQPAPPAAKQHGPVHAVAVGEGGAYAVQVGIFAHPQTVREALTKQGFTLQESVIEIKGRDYTQIRVPGFDDRHAAQEAAAQIARLLRLQPQVVRLERE